MQTLTKEVSRQDANFKLSPSTSNETSINLSKDISALISDESGEITFKIFKSDFIKALSVLCILPAVYLKKDERSCPCNEIFTMLSELINNEFEERENSFYTVSHLKREDGRFYLNNLKKANGFNVRAFLIEQHSYLTFIKNDEGELILRLETIVPKEELSEDIKATIVETKNEDTKKPLQIIYYGAPGTGKSYKIDQLTTEENSVRTTFHPDSDYASFVGAYKPTMEDVPISAIVGKEVHEAVPQGKHSGKEKKIVYKYVPQAFLKAYVEAWRRYADGMNYENPVDIPYYLIIEEINRGNCAQIFGDLFQLLDRNNMGASSYPIQADEDIARFLKEDENGFSGFSDDQRRILSNFTLEKDNGDEREIGEDIINGKLLLLPPNLRIWATMNTSDQSLFPIDSAFKRRWDWEYMPIKYDVKDWTFQIGESLYSWGDFLRKINPEIYALTESADKQMGYFFVKANKQTRIIPENMFLNKVLFYLWTEVFKDFDISSEIFKNKKEHRSFRFTDFFEDEEALSNFIDNLGLEPITVEDEKESEDKDWEDKDDEGNEEEKERTLTPTTETQKWYQEIWTKTRNKYLEQGCDFNVAPNVKNWFEKRLGTGGIVLENKINRKEGSSCVGIYLYKNAANKYYSKLLAYKQDIEKDLPFELKWEGPTEKRGCASIRVIESVFNFKDLEDQERAIDWMVTRGIQIEKAFKPYIDKLK